MATLTDTGEPTCSCGGRPRPGRLKPGWANDLDLPAIAPVALSRAEPDAWYTDRLLSLEQIAALAAEWLGVPVSKTKVRERLRALGIPRRTFSQAARARALKRRAATDASSTGSSAGGPLRLFPRADGGDGEGQDGGDGEA